MCSGEQNVSISRGQGSSYQGSRSGNQSNTQQFCLPTVPSREEGWGTEASDRPKSVCEDRTFQNGISSPLPDLLQPGDWMVNLKDVYLQVPIPSSPFNGRRISTCSSVYCLAYQQCPGYLQRYSSQLWVS